jgi:hypothetical protein
MHEQLRWFDASANFQEILPYASAWSGSRSLHVLDCLGYSGKIASLGQWCWISSANIPFWAVWHICRYNTIIFNHHQPYIYILFIIYIYYNISVKYIYILYNISIYIISIYIISIYFHIYPYIYLYPWLSLTIHIYIYPYIYNQLWSYIRVSLYSQLFTYK